MDVRGATRLSGCVLSLPAGILESSEIESENRCHRAGSDWHRLLHVLAALRDRAHGVGKAQSSGGHMRRVFAETVSGEVSRSDAAIGEHSLSGNGDRQDGWLGDLRESQLLFTPVKAQLGQRITERTIRF